MAKVEFEEVKIYEWHEGTEERKFCYAYMCINNKPFPCNYKRQAIENGLQ
jgi:hypothetical protein